MRHNLTPPDQAGLSPEALASLTKLAGRKSSHRVLESYFNFANDVDSYSELTKIREPLVTEKAFAPEITEELKTAGYLLPYVPAGETEPTSGVYVNALYDFHPKAIFTGVHSPSKEIIVREAESGCIIASLQGTYVNSYRDDGRYANTNRLRVISDAVDEEHGTSFIAEIVFATTGFSIMDSGTTILNGVLTSLSGYKLGDVPDRTPHEDCTRYGDTGCEIRYESSYSPSSSTTSRGAIPADISTMKPLDVFKGTIVTVEIRDI